MSSVLALALVAGALFGGGPLASHGTDHVRAKPRCVPVRVARVERRGDVVQGPGGQPSVVYRNRPVTRTVRRCR